MKILCTRFNTVIYLTGNHEFYGSSIPEVHECINIFAHAHDNFKWLNNTVIELTGKRIVGTTLWFPQSPTADRYMYGFSDFKAIKDSYTQLFRENTRAVEFLNRVVRAGDTVITHHLPTVKSVSAQYAGSPINCYFVCPMDKLIDSRKPALWIHGHTHDSKDYAFSKETKIICNPYGYAGITTNALNPSYTEPKIVVV